MGKKNKLKAELILEVAQLHERVAELETADTEQKQALEMLQDSERRFKTIYTDAAIGIDIADADGSPIIANRALQEMLGYSEDELRRMVFADYTPPDAMADSLRLAQEVREGKRDHFTMEKRYIRKDGAVIWGHTSVSGLRDARGNFQYFIAMVDDITERKQAEEALQIERDNLENVLEAMEDGVYIVSQQYDIQYVNPVLETEFGPYEGHKCYAYFHDRDDVCPWCKNEDVFAGKTVRWEWHLSKNQRTYDLIDTPLKNPDGSISKLEIFRDITERKQAEDAIRRRAEELSTLLRVSQALNATLEMETVLQTTTDSATELIGIHTAAIYLLEGEELYLGATTPPLDPQMPETFRRALLVDHPHIQKSISTAFPVIMPDAATADLTSAERVIVKARGLRTIVFVPILVGQRTLGTLIIGTIGKPRAFSEAEINLCQTLANQVAISIQNAGLHEKSIQHSEELKNQIGVRKQAEAEVARLATVIEQAPVTVVITDLSGDIIYANPEFEASTGYTVAEALGQNPSILKSGRQDALFYKELWDNIAEGRSWNGIFINKRKDGELYHEEATIFPIKNASGEIVSYAAVKRDVSKRVQVEKALQDSENKLIEAQKVAKLGHYVLNVKTGFWTSSPVLDDIFGMDENYKKDVAGWLQTVHPDSREAMSDYFQENILSQHQNFDKEYKIINLKTGQEKWVHGLGNLRFDNNNNPIEMFGTIQDTTDHKQVEQEKHLLFEQVQVANERLRFLSRELINSQEEERKHIAQELHDELGQALTAISLDLGIIERDLHPEITQDIAERLSGTRAMADELDEKISELALDLRPSLLDDLGLLPALRWYVDRYSQRAEVEIEMDIIGLEERLHPEIETTLYRVFQEALTNVARHAQASKVRLQIERRPTAVAVYIEDDGRGFDAEVFQITEAPLRSLGLTGMKERISLLGGRMDIHSKPGEGTRIDIEIPL